MCIRDSLQTFSDDPLRMMRAIRFASQLGFTIEQKTFQAIKDEADRISIVSQERITDELVKIIDSPIPSIGFDLLYQLVLLHIIPTPMLDRAAARDTPVTSPSAKSNHIRALPGLRA